MFISIKKKTVLAVILALLTVLSICLIAIPISSSASSAPTGKTIVIDAGHGGIDGGVTGINTGTKESDINLTISRALKKTLENAGYRVVMTRSNSDGLYGLSSKSKKQKDMAERSRIINEAGADLVVSIHQNQYSRPSVRGAQVFYAKDSESGKSLAAVMQKTLNANLEACTRTEAVGDYYILQCSPTPSVLVECGFLSSPEDEKLLLDSSYQNKIAYCIYSAIDCYFGSLNEKQDNN